MQEVLVNQRWKHYNGNEYEVLMFTNELSTNPKYPVTVVYKNIHTGSTWSKPLDDWHRSMTLIEPA